MILEEIVPMDHEKWDNLANRLYREEHEE